MMKRVGLVTALLFSLTAQAEHGGPPARGEPLVIDVRTAGEYQEAHVRKAVNIPYDEIAERIAAIAPDRDARIVLYCRSGRRSDLAQQSLRQLGYQQTTNGGGLDSMVRNGYRTD